VAAKNFFVVSATTHRGTNKMEIRDLVTTPTILAVVTFLVLLLPLWLFRNKKKLEFYKELQLETVPDNPFSLFRQWHDEQEQWANYLYKQEGRRWLRPEVFVLATADLTGTPSVRCVLMREFSEDCIFFTTSKDSRKGQDIVTNPKVTVALLFYWPSLRGDRQIRMWGRCEMVTDPNVRAKHWRALPRDWQSGWHGTQQGHSLEDGRKDSMKRIAQEIEEKYKNRDIPIAPDFEVYRIVPEGVEVYQSGHSLLDHDRILYTLQSPNSWKKQRIMP
jgi:pyridoxamine 5'-phosphate oxidase